MSGVLAASLPPVSPEFFDKLKQAFRPIEVTPETEINDIMYSAGQQAVLAWIQNAVRGTIITGGSIDSRSGQ